MQLSLRCTMLHYSINEIYRHQNIFVSVLHRRIEINNAISHTLELNTDESPSNCGCTVVMYLIQFQIMNQKMCQMQAHPISPGLLTLGSRAIKASTWGLCHGAAELSCFSRPLCPLFQQEHNRGWDVVWDVFYAYIHWKLHLESRCW